MATERLQKIIAAAGIASRRHAEEMIQQGRVSVNGQIVSELGSKADPERDHIKVDGKLLHGPERHLYLMLNKPKGYVTTVTDPEHRPTIMELIPRVGARVYPAGRLDYNSEGLLLLTNDGPLVERLTHASSHLPKTYLVKVSGQPAAADIERLRRGVTLPPARVPGKLVRRDAKPVKTAPARIRTFREAENPWYEVTLIEGRNRQIRRMFEVIGHHVEKIRRIQYGPLALDVEPGKYRELTPREVDRLKAAVKRAPAARKEAAPEAAQRPSAKGRAPRSARSRGRGKAEG
jgi:23S rRNA pseudouridine2605 synthase